MEPRIVVIGMGLFGTEVALSLTERGYSVLAIDSDAEMVEAVKDHVAQALVLDTTVEAALYQAKVDEASTVVNAIGTGHVQNSILTTALLRQLEIPRIIARAANPLHARILRQVGATEVVNPEEDMGRKLAYQIARPGIREILTLAEDVCVADVPAPPSFVGRTLAELDVRAKYGVTVIGVQRVRLAPGLGAATDSERSRSGRNLLDQNRRFILNVDPQRDRILEDDTLVVIGREDGVSKLSGLG